MRTLPVRLLDLAAALEDHSHELWDYYFDTRSGEVLFLSQDRGIDPKSWKRISDSFGRFVEIEPMSSRKGYEIMEEFVAKLPGGPIREKLQWSLEGAKPFRRFKATIYENQEIRDQWAEFHNQAMRNVAKEWLAERDIEPVEPESFAAVRSSEDQDSDPDDTEVDEDLKDDDYGNEDLDEGAGDEEESDSSLEDVDVDEFDQSDYGELLDELSEEEEAEVVDFLQSLPDSEFRLAKLHGLLSAFAAGPVMVSPKEILDAIKASVETPESDRLVDLNSDRIQELLGRFYDSITADLESGDFSPQLHQQGVMVTNVAKDFVSWCQGFVLGMRYHHGAWERWFDDVRRCKAISLIMGMAQPEVLERAEKAIGEETAWTTWGMMSELVSLIHDYWVFETSLDDYLGAGAEEAEFEVGQNDPCPCGSGKKFKHCHGNLGLEQ
jgi:yecA family protein